MKVNSLVLVEGYGEGIIKGVSDDKEYPINVEFLNENLRDYDGYFRKEQVKAVVK